MKKKSTQGYGCLMLFGLPFLAAGLFVMYQGASHLLTGRPLPGPEAPSPWLALLSGLPFIAAGGGLVFGPLVWSAYVRRVDRLRDQGRILPVFAQPLYVPLVFGVLWNLITWTGIGAFLSTRETPRFVFLGLGLFAVIGIGMATWLGRELRLRWKFGTLRLHLAEVPRPGGLEMPWELIGPTARLRAPRFEIALREETLVEKGENNYRWEGSDLQVAPAEVTAMPGGWRGALRIPKDAPAPIEEERHRRRWIVRVRDGKTEAAFPIPA